MAQGEKQILSQETDPEFPINNSFPPVDSVVNYAYQSDGFPISKVFTPAPGQLYDSDGRPLFDSDGNPLFQSP